jgi:hypothetical protein
MNSERMGRMAVHVVAQGWGTAPAAVLIERFNEKGKGR